MCTLMCFRCFNESDIDQLVQCMLFLKIPSSLRKLIPRYKHHLYFSETFVQLYYQQFASLSANVCNLFWILFSIADLEIYNNYVKCAFQINFTMNSCACTKVQGQLILFKQCLLATHAWSEIFFKSRNLMFLFFKYNQ